MTQLRLGFYVLYVVLGAIILVRVLSTGLRVEALAGVLLGIALIALGLYRIALFVRTREANRHS